MRRWPRRYLLPTIELISSKLRVETTWACPLQVSNNTPRQPDAANEAPIHRALKAVASNEAVQEGTYAANHGRNEQEEGQVKAEYSYYAVDDEKY